MRNNKRSYLYFHQKHTNDITRGVSSHCREQRIKLPSHLSTVQSSSHFDNFYNKKHKQHVDDNISFCNQSYLSKFSEKQKKHDTVKENNNDVLSTKTEIVIEQLDEIKKSFSVEEDAERIHPDTATIVTDLISVQDSMKRSTTSQSWYNTRSKKEIITAPTKNQTVHSCIIWIQVVQALSILIEDSPAIPASQPCQLDLKMTGSVGSLLQLHFRNVSSEKRKR